MHVALFSDTFLPQVNGAANVVANLARGLVRAGHEVTVGTVRCPGSEAIDAEAQREGYHVVRYASAELPTYQDMRVAVPTVIKSLRWAHKRRPDVVHVHTNFGIGWEGVALAKLLGVPLIGTHHTFLLDYRAHVKLDLKHFDRGVELFTHKLVSSFYNRCALVTSPSRALEQDLRDSGVTVPVERLPNPVDVAFFADGVAHRDTMRTQLGLSGPALVYLGRVSYEKNLPVLIQAATPVLTARVDRRLIIIGDGPDRQHLQALVAQQGLERQVIFTGMLRGAVLAQTVAAGDVFVSPSLTENQPISVIEAAAAGLPAVVFDARGMPEIVTDKTNGRLIKTGDAAAMSAVLQELLSDTAQHQRLSKGARVHAQTFSLDNVTQQLLDRYQRLLP